MFKKIYKKNWKQKNDGVDVTQREHSNIKYYASAFSNNIDL